MARPMAVAGWDRDSAGWQVAQVTAAGGAAYAAVTMSNRMVRFGTPKTL